LEKRQRIVAKEDKRLLGRITLATREDASAATLLQPAPLQINSPADKRQQIGRFGHDSAIVYPNSNDSFAGIVSKPGFWWRASSTVLGLRNVVTRPVFSLLAKFGKML
jgi:hypothetical protein